MIGACEGLSGAFQDTLGNVLQLRVFGVDRSLVIQVHGLFADLLDEVMSIKICRCLSNIWDEGYQLCAGLNCFPLASRISCSDSSRNTAAFLLTSDRESPALRIHGALPMTSRQSGGTLHWKNHSLWPFLLFR